MFSKVTHWLAAAKLVVGPRICIPTPAKLEMYRSLKDEYHRPVSITLLASRKNASSLVLPTEPTIRKPERRTLEAATWAVCGITNTGLLPLTDCRMVPGIDAPIPMIFRLFRRVICFTV